MPPAHLQSTVLDKTRGCTPAVNRRHSRHILALPGRGQPYSSHLRRSNRSPRRQTPSPPPLRKQRRRRPLICQSLGTHWRLWLASSSSSRRSCGQWPVTLPPQTFRRRLFIVTTAARYRYNHQLDSASRDPSTASKHCLLLLVAFAMASDLRPAPVAVDLPYVPRSAFSGFAFIPSAFLPPHRV